MLARFAIPILIPLLSGCLGTANGEESLCLVEAPAEMPEEEAEEEESPLAESAAPRQAPSTPTRGVRDDLDGVADEELVPVLKHVERQAQEIQQQEDELQQIIRDLKVILCEELLRHGQERGWHEGRNLPPKVSLEESEEGHAEWDRFFSWWSECPAAQGLPEETRERIVAHVTEYAFQVGSAATTPEEPQRVVRQAVEAQPPLAANP